MWRDGTFGWSGLCPARSVNCEQISTKHPIKLLSKQYARAGSLTSCDRFVVPLIFSSTTPSLKAHSILTFCSATDRSRSNESGKALGATTMCRGAFQRGEQIDCEINIALQFVRLFAVSLDLCDRQGFLAELLVALRVLEGVLFAEFPRQRFGLPTAAVGVVSRLGGSNAVTLTNFGSTPPSSSNSLMCVALSCRNSPVVGSMATHPALPMCTSTQACWPKLPPNVGVYTRPPTSRAGMPAARSMATINVECGPQSPFFFSSASRADGVSAMV